MAATRLHLAAYDGDTEAINCLLAEGSDIDARDSKGNTPLLLAALTNETDAVRTLLKWGADVNALPDEGPSALRRAAQHGNPEMVRMLLAKGADPDRVALKKPTPVPQEDKDRFRERMGRLQKVKKALGLRLSEEESQKPEEALSQLNPTEESAKNWFPGPTGVLCLAIGSRNTETVRVLLEAGFSPNYPVDPKVPLQTPPLELAMLQPDAHELVVLLLAHGADPNRGMLPDLPPLISAIMKKDTALVQLLIEGGANLEDKAVGMSLLTFAVGRNDLAMASFLLEHNALPQDRMAMVLARCEGNHEMKALLERYMRTDWFAAIRQPDLETLRNRLAQGVDLSARDEDGQTGLHIAAQVGSTEAVRLLLEAGSATEPRDNFRFTPLHEAAKRGKTEIVGLLLEAGADPLASDKSGYTPLSLAAWNGHAKTADLLMAQGAAPTIVDAIRLQRHDLMAELWERGTPVNFSNDVGDTPLHAAARGNDTNLIQELLARGASVALQNRWKHTPLYYAVENRGYESARLLLENGADPNERAGGIANLVHNVAQRWDAGMVELLLSHGATVARPPLPDGTALNDARYSISAELIGRYRTSVKSDGLVPVPDWQDISRLWETIHVLLDAGDNPNGNTEEFGGEPLLTALLHHDAPTELIRLAVVKGADIQPEDFSLRPSPLNAAIDKGRLDVVALLLEAGAPVNGGLSESSPLELAEERGKPEIIALLQRFGASHERREAALAELGEIGALFAAGRNAAQPTDNDDPLNLEGLRASVRAERREKITSYRVTLEAEVLAGEVAQVRD